MFTQIYTKEEFIRFSQTYSLIHIVLLLLLLSYLFSVLVKELP